MIMEVSIGCRMFQAGVVVIVDVSVVVDVSGAVVVIVDVSVVVDVQQQELLLLWMSLLL